MGFPPKSSHFNRDFHYFHHPFWGTHIFGNTHILTYLPLSVYLSTYLPLYLSTYPCIYLPFNYLPFYLFMYLTIFLSVHLSTIYLSLPIFLPIYRSINQSKSFIYLSIYLSICLFVCLYFSVVDFFSFLSSRPRCLKITRCSRTSLPSSRSKLSQLCISLDIHLIRG